MTATALNHESNRITELMEAPAEEHVEQWLKEALQQAVMLELATLTPYLCGLWSIRDPSQSPDAFGTVQEIVSDEMCHMGLVCNMLTTIGGTPLLADGKLVPKYPGPLPGGVRPELTVSLSGLTKQTLEMYSQIENPGRPCRRGQESPHVDRSLLHGNSGRISSTPEPDLGNQTGGQGHVAPWKGGRGLRTHLFRRRRESSEDHQGAG